jgi:hypothetical protein
MCGRYTLRTPWQRLAEYFGLRVTDLPELFAPRGIGRYVTSVHRTTPGSSTHQF